MVSLLVIKLALRSAMTQTPKPNNIILEEVRKIKKDEPKVFPFLLMIDKEAFGKLEEQVYILK